MIWDLSSPKCISVCLSPNDKPDMVSRERETDELCPDCKKCHLFVGMVASLEQVSAFVVLCFREQAKQTGTSLTQYNVTMTRSVVLKFHAENL